MPSPPSQLHSSRRLNWEVADVGTSHTGVLHSDKPSSCGILLPSLSALLSPGGGSNWGQQMKFWGTQAFHAYNLVTGIRPEGHKALSPLQEKIHCVELEERKTNGKNSRIVSGLSFQEWGEWVWWGDRCLSSGTVRSHQLYQRKERKLELILNF